MMDDREIIFEFKIQVKVFNVVKNIKEQGIITIKSKNLVIYQYPLIYKIIYFKYRII